jgi:hypothetical protein
MTRWLVVLLLSCMISTAARGGRFWVNLGASPRTLVPDAAKSLGRLPALPMLELPDLEPLPTESPLSAPPLPPRSTVPEEPASLDERPGEGLVHASAAPSRSCPSEAPTPAQTSNTRSAFVRLALGARVVTEPRGRAIRWLRKGTPVPVTALRKDGWIRVAPPAGPGWVWESSLEYR